MAKARGPAVDVDALARPLLIALAEGETRLLGTGEPTALLSSKTGANKPLYVHLTTGERPLVSVRKVGKDEHARLTVAGFLAALPHLPTDRVGELARREADRLPPAERLPFLLTASQAASGESAAFLAAAVDVLQAEVQAQAEAAAKRRAAEAQIIDRLVALIRADIARLGSELEEAHAFIKRLTGDTAPPPPPAVPLPPTLLRQPTAEPLAPSEPDDLPFRRQVLQRLATAWAEAFDNRRDEGRRYLEAAIHNLRGVSPVGEPGDEVSFDGVVHRAGRAVADGDPVRVVRPGWVLDEDGLRFVVLPAEVE